MTRPNSKESLGSSVVDGVIRFTSVSQMQSFDPDEVGGCNRKWHLERVSKLGKRVQIAAQAAGEEMHGQVEHYLKSGEMVLGVVARQGKHFIPAPLTEAPGIRVEYNFGDSETVKAFDAWRAGEFAPKRNDKLIVGGNIPVIGYIDLVNERDHWLDNDGRKVLFPSRHEAEVCDWKSTSSIESWAKEPSDLPRSLQMVGYGQFMTLLRPDLERVRLSHGYFQTKGRGARKVSISIPVDTISKGWQRIESVVRAMKDAAREKDSMKIEPNWSACSAYKGCPHKALCPRSPERVFADLFGTKKKKGEGKGMSLLNRMKNRNNGTEGNTQRTLPYERAPGDPGLQAQVDKAVKDSDDHAQRVQAAQQAASDATAAKPDLQAEIEALKAGEKAGNVDDRGVCSVDGIPLTASNSTRFPDGSVVHHGCANQAAALETIRKAPSPDASRKVLAMVDQIGAVVVDGYTGPLNSVLSPDAPLSRPPENAEPVSPEEALAQAPEVRQAIKQWEAEGAAFGDPPKGTKVPTSVDEHVNNYGKAQERYATWDRDALKAECMKRGLVNQASKKSADALRSLLAAHDNQQAQNNTIQSGPRPTDEQLKDEARDGTRTEEVKPIVTDDGTYARKEREGITRPPAITVDNAQPFPRGIWLFIGTAIQGIVPISLDGWVDKLATDLANECGVIDIRFAPNDNPLAFNKWRGALAGLVRSELPEPGVYTLTDVHESEIKQVVLEALRPHCAVVVRGIR